MNICIQNLIDNKPKAILLSGLPGSGKSTTAIFFRQNGYFIICKDDIRHRLACRRYYYKPETFFEQSQLHQFSKLVHTVNENICFAYQQYLKGKDKFDIIDKTKTRFYRGYHNMNNQDIIFDTIKSYIIEFTEHNLNQGIVFDATYLTTKSRRSIIQNIKLPIYCIFYSIPSDIAYKRVLNRSKTIISYYHEKPVYGRFVPMQAIKRMESTITIPNKIEGFDDVFIIPYQTTENKSTQIMDFITNFKCNQEYHDLAMDLFPSFSQTNNLSQHNENHYYTVDWHMMYATEYVKKYSKDKALILATLLHDVGKFDTKAFYINLTKPIDNYKEGKKFKVKYILNRQTYVCQNTFNFDIVYIDKNDATFDMNAHYYAHQYTSAIKAYNDLISLNVNHDFAYKVYLYIFFHMYIPFHHTITYKELYTLKNYLTKDECKNLLLLRQADQYSQHIQRNMKQFHDNFQLDEMYNKDEMLINDIYKTNYFK